MQQKRCAVVCAYAYIHTTLLSLSTGIVAMWLIACSAFPPIHPSILHAPSTSALCSRHLTPSYRGPLASQPSLLSCRLTTPSLIMHLLRPSATSYFQEFKCGHRKGPGNRLFHVDDNMEPQALFDDVAELCRWGAKTVRKERRLLDASIEQYQAAISAALAGARTPHVPPLSLPYFQGAWLIPFIVDNTVGATQNFYRLSLFCRWSPEDKRLELAKLNRDIARHINAHHTKVEHYREIIKRYKTSRHPLPQHHTYDDADVDNWTITHCKRVIQNRIFVNIHHFIDGDQQFDSYAELRRYTKNHKFPRHEAKQDTAMRVLLKHFKYVNNSGIVTNL